MRAAAPIIIIAVLVLAPSARATAAAHPRLIDVDTAKCVGCHDKMWDHDATLHPPVADDCTTCHELAIAEGGTEVTLMEEGTALCLICHDEVSAAVAGELEAPHFPVTDGCGNCHEPHASREPGLLTGPLVEVCHSCHQAADLEGPHDGQLTATANCSACHQPHGSQNPQMLAGRVLHSPFSSGSCKGCHRPPFADQVRLRSRREDLCTACHREFSQPAGGSLHAALQGDRLKAGCLSCHDPHMSLHSGLLLAAGAELCGSCHAEVVTAATADGGHSPAADDCLSCHRPHEADEPRLLSEPAGELCARCHDPGDEELIRTHLGADLGTLTCTGCHTPHGSDHPALLARYLHDPVTMGCDTCHDETHDRFLDEVNAICLMCHEEVGETAAAAAVPHAAFEMATCADCHNPHASSQERLVKAPGAGACTDCHDDQLAGEGEVAHGVIDLLGCQACHEPHGGDQPKLLRRTASELCRDCHEMGRIEVAEEATTITLLDHFEVPAELAPTLSRVRLSGGTRDHPLRGHLTLGTPTEEEIRRSGSTYTGELNCLTCHQPHKGPSRRLLRWGAVSAMEACLNCHPK